MCVVRHNQYQGLLFAVCMLVLAGYAKVVMHVVSNGTATSNSLQLLIANKKFEMLLVYSVRSTSLITETLCVIEWNISDWQICNIQNLLKLSPY